MQSSVEIRSATASDVEHVLPMVQRLADVHRAWDAAKYPYKSNVAEMYRRWMIARSDDPRSVFLVALREGKPIGFLIGTVEREIPIYALSEFGFIHDLWIEPGYRNEGIARQMVMLAIERFAALGAAQVRLDTATDNHIARSLFTSCGFRPSTIEMLIELPGAS